MNISRSKTFYINSKDRLNGTTSSFQFRLDQNIQGYKYCALLTASIPKSWYLITSKHNTFTLDENGSLFTITIPVGNYSFSRLGSVISALLNASGAWTYSVVADLITGHYVFTVTDNGGVQPSFIITTDKLSDILGTDTGTIPFVGDTLESVYVCDLQLTSSVFVNLDIVENNILQDITSTISDYGYLTYINNNFELSSKRITNSSTDVISVELIDRVSRETLDLNGLDIVLTIIFFNRDNTVVNFYKWYPTYLRLQEERREIDEQ